MFREILRRIRQAASFEGLPLAVLIGIGFGVAAAAVAFFGAQQLIPDRVAEWLSGQDLGDALYWRLARFVAAQLVLHVCFGFVIWGLAAASARALPQLGWTRTRWILAWGFAGVTWVFLLNIDQFPESVTSRVVCCELIPHDFYSGMAAFVTSLVLAAAAIIVWLNVARSPNFVRFAPRIVVWGAVIAASVMTASWLRSEAIASGESALRQPNVIIIGIDSLRADYIGVGGREPGMTPNVDAFLQEGILLADCLTPLGRTFPAWVSILSGQSPRTNEVRENLFPVKQATLDASVAHAFRRAGYRTVYGTDEVRFSNIDHRFGFDELLSPPMGVSDFLLGAANDLPLANLVANTEVGELLFPETHANRAAAVTYEPDSFVDRVASALDDGTMDRPLFLAVHLALPHWPYTWAQEDDDGGFSRLSDTRYQYGASVMEVDRQFGELVYALERAGTLRNAIVVVLSDHGEGLGLARDNLLFSKQAKEAVGALSVAMWGHGNSVLSPYQNQVVLGMRGFGRSTLRRGPGVLHDVPASLEDVTPTLLGLTGIADATKRDGVDWSRLLQAAEAQPEGMSRVRFIETGYIVGFTNRGTIDTNEVAGAGVQKYLIDPHSSRITIRHDALPALLREKERAAIRDGLILSTLLDQGRRRYVLVDQSSGGVRELKSVPTVEESKVHSLWAALHREYGAELTGDFYSPE